MSSKKNKTTIKDSIEDNYNFPVDTNKLERKSMKYRDDGSDKAFKYYDPKLDKRKYPVYRNDIKYKKHRNVDPSRALWNDDVKNDFHNKDTDSIEYRIEECIREKYAILDLSHMDANCFEKLFSDQTFLSIITKIQHLFAKDCHLKNVPRLDGMISLQTFDVSCNKLKELPKLPESIEELIVNDNKLTSITNDMPKLLRLNCDNNYINNIKFSDTLERIHIKNNPIEKIPDLDRIYYLDASLTKIKTVGNFPNLKHLFVGSTCVSAIRDLKCLELLYCNSSSVKNITNTPNMQSIEMVDTHVECLPFMAKLNRLTYTQSNKFKLSKRYRIYSVKKNKNDIIELTFKTE